MLRYALLFLLLVHGLIHLMGFVKAFRLAEIPQLTQAISRPVGLFWGLTTLLFLLSAVLYFMNSPNWFFPAAAGILLSQVLIFLSWQDAKFGTLANVVLLIAVIPAWGSWSFENSFKKDYRASLERTQTLETPLITEADLKPLPEPVQKYLRYVGVVGKPRIRTMRAQFEGEMRNKGDDWFLFTSEQYNFYDQFERFFFMKARVKGLAANGYHAFYKRNASMQVKVLSLFPVVDIEGEELRKAETVTVFNDMCIMVPAALIDKRIQWEAIDSLSAKAVFAYQDVSISAILYFDEQGSLINFVSDDRISVSDMKQYRFSTPLSKEYKDYNGFRLTSFGEAVWHYPDGEFVYGKFNVKDIVYN
jgi:hypothetical protein